MSNHLYTIASGGRHIETRLLYVTNAKYEGDWHSTPIPIIFLNFFYVLGDGDVFGGHPDFRRGGSRSRHRQPPRLPIPRCPAQTALSNTSCWGLKVSVFPSTSPEPTKITACSITGTNRLPRVRNSSPYLHALLKEAEASEPYGEEVCQNLLEVLMIIMMRHSEFTLSVMPSKRANVACAQVKRHIDTHFRDALTLEELAELVHVNKYHLVHTFSTDYGLSPIQYLISRRIEEGKNLLRTTDYSIAQIASFRDFPPSPILPRRFKVYGHEPDSTAGRPAVPEGSSG